MATETTDPALSESTFDREQDLLRQIEGLRRELDRSQRMASVGAVSSSITHEFNNVLTTVINYAQMGLRRDDAAVKEKAFQRILTAGRRAAEMTTGLLALARGDSPEKHPADLTQLVKQVLVLTEKDLQKHRISLHVDLAEPSPWVAVQAAQIQQVVLNLVLNARQAMQPGGSLLVQTGTEETMALVAVRDTGCGIDPESLRTIFEPLYTTKTADADGCGGTGLGLSTCRQIVEDHGGRIRVESAVRRGTTFTILLPTTAAAALVSTAD